MCRFNQLSGMCACECGVITQLLKFYGKINYVRCQLLSQMRGVSQFRLTLNGHSTWSKYKLPCTKSMIYAPYEINWTWQHPGSGNVFQSGSPSRKIRRADAPTERHFSQQIDMFECCWEVVAKPRLHRRHIHRRLLYRSLCPSLCRVSRSDLPRARSNTTTHHPASADLVRPAAYPADERCLAALVGVARVLQERCSLQDVEEDGRQADVERYDKHKQLTLLTPVLQTATIINFTVGDGDTTNYIIKGKKSDRFHSKNISS